jgi:hypothetical protein
MRNKTYELVLFVRAAHQVISAKNIAAAKVGLLDAFVGIVIYRVAGIGI